MVVGFYWGGWSLGSTADKMAKERSELAVVAALAPVCADKFRAQPDAEAKQVALSKVESWKRRAEFPKEFVTLPGEFPAEARRIAMWFYVQMWLPLLTVALTAAICFSVASFIMARSANPHRL
jgi:hypothetical protein